MSNPQYRKTPLPTDVIIRRIAKGSHGFILSTVANGEQITCSTRASAMALSTKYAEVQGVCVWEIDDRGRFELVFDDIAAGLQ